MKDDIQILQKENKMLTNKILDLQNNYFLLLNDLKNEKIKRIVIQKEITNLFRKETLCEEFIQTNKQKDAIGLYSDASVYRFFSFVKHKWYDIINNYQI
jgi:hypothetical protein